MHVADKQFRFPSTSRLASSKTFFQTFPYAIPAEHNQDKFVQYRHASITDSMRQRCAERDECPIGPVTSIRRGLSAVVKTSDKSLAVQDSTTRRSHPRHGTQTFTHTSCKRHERCNLSDARQTRTAECINYNERVIIVYRPSRVPTNTPAARRLVTDFSSIQFIQSFVHSFV
jgi:hypothetical protein